MKSSEKVKVVLMLREKSTNKFMHKFGGLIFPTLTFMSVIFSISRS